jgi:nitroreductase
MKKEQILVILTVAFLVLGAAEAGAQSDGSRDAYDVIRNNFSPSSQWMAGAIPRADLEKIVAAGVRAPSAMNKQPWLFTVVTDEKLAGRIVGRMPTGSVIFVISATENPEKNPKIYIDCGLATENIYLAAEALGYGARILTGPMRSFNDSLKNDLDIPSDAWPVAVVRVGSLKPGVDAVSSASRRKSADKVVNWK